MTVHHVPHCTASGSLRRRWEYLAEERRLIVSVELGNRDVTFAVDVCSREHPRFGAVPLTRIDGETWRLLPERFTRRWQGGREILEPARQPITQSLGPGDMVVLSNAPPLVAAQLELL